MKNYWLLLALSVVIGTTAAWTMNYIDYGHRDVFFGEITMDGSVNADNVMAKLSEYHSESAAKVELDGDPVYDFGAMPPGASGSHTFTIKNVGTEPLQLELGATTCKCTLGDLEDNELEPGESTSVSLEWTVKSTEQIFEQSAELRTNDPLRPGVRFVVRGLIIRDLEFVPRKITFGEILSGQPFEFSTKMYSYFDRSIEPVSADFASEELTKFADFEIEPFELSEEDDVHENARQAFLVTAKIRPGVRQGPLVTRMQVKFRLSDQLAPGVVAEETETGEDAELDPPPDEILVGFAECAGRIMGALTLLPTPQVRTTSGGGYVWTLGRLGPDDKLEHRALVALKGSEKDSTNLRIGETYPSDIVEAEFGDPVGKGQMRLFPLNLKLKAGTELIDLLGKNKDDFGWIWIESDNPNVGRLKVAVKALIEPRP